jgi:hypothetical protein
MQKVAEEDCMWDFGIKGKCHFKLVHVLVAKAFIPNPLNLPEVNHLGKSDDCRANMLEWRTKLGNVQHSVATERKGTGGVSFEKEKKALGSVSQYKLYSQICEGLFPSRKRTNIQRVEKH